MINYTDRLIKFYNHQAQNKQSSVIDFDEFTITNPNTGIGDALCLYLIDQPIPNKIIYTIILHPSIREDLYHFNKFIGHSKNSYSRFHSLLNVWDIQLHSNYGGHFFQRIQQFLNLPIDIVPRAKLSSNIDTIKNKVVMTFDKGIVDQKHIHPRARLIYQESKEIIQAFINKYQHIYSFVEVGKQSLGLDNVDVKINLGIKKTAEEIASCEYFFGNHNGLMHIAAGLCKKSIIIINFPSSNKLILPCLRKTNVVDIDWLYPQNVHLHQEDDDTIFVNKLTLTNLEKAFDHQLYPFFSTKFIEETFQHIYV